MEFRKHFDYDVEAASNEAVVINNEPSLTVQSMSEDADINVLMDRYGITGKFPENPRIPEYGDYDDVGDFQSAMNVLVEANNMFMEYPAKFRARFDNDPQKFLEFVRMENGEYVNGLEMEKLGLFKEEVVAKRQRARADAEAAAFKASVDAEIVARAAKAPGST